GFPDRSGTANGRGSRGAQWACRQLFLVERGLCVGLLWGCGAHPPELFRLPTSTNDRGVTSGEVTFRLEREHQVAYRTCACVRVLETEGPPLVPTGNPKKEPLRATRHGVASVVRLEVEGRRAGHVGHQPTPHAATHQRKPGTLAVGCLGVRRRHLRPPLGALACR